jgi:primase-polymerase (primpol)-like protein
MNRFKNLPQSLIDIPRWLLYFLLTREPGTKPAKIPVDPNTLNPGNRPEHCASFEMVVDLFQNARPMPFMEPPVEPPPFAGIGFRFEYDATAPFVFVDLDDCFNRETGDPEPWAVSIVERLDSYTELSASGSGLHILLRSSQPPAQGCRRGKIEIYSKGRWAAMTGHHIEGTPRDLEDRTQELLALHRELFQPPSSTPAVRTATRVLLPDQEILRRARAARNGARFRQLYDELPTRPNHSEEDLELSGMLAFWTVRDPAQIDQLFRGSKLMRQKWERTDYRNATIQKAIANCKRAFGEFPDVATPAEVKHG